MGTRVLFHASNGPKIGTYGYGVHLAALQSAHKRSEDFLHSCLKVNFIFLVPELSSFMQFWSSFEALVKYSSFFQVK